MFVVWPEALNLTASDFNLQINASSADLLENIETEKPLLEADDFIEIIRYNWISINFPAHKLLMRADFMRLAEIIYAA